jgi:hypothetical protein
MVGTATARVGDRVAESLVGPKMGALVTGDEEEGTSGAKEGDTGDNSFHGACDTLVGLGAGPAEGTTSVNGVTVGATT